jgi:hypothetical protein
LQKAYSPQIGAGAAPQNVVRIGITPNDDLLFPALAVEYDVPHFLSWGWFV